MSKEVRLIDANALSRNIEADHIVAKAMFKGIDIPLDATFGVIDYDIKSAPTIDAVEVVRCKDCMHKTDLLKGIHACAVLMIKVHDDFYCANGKRKEVKI